MSYILDALNKSEKEQRPQSVPSINVPHATASRRPGTLVYATAFVMLLAVNATAIYLWTGKDSGKRDQIAIGDSSTPISLSTLPVSTGLAPLSTLPVPVQQQVRALKFSSHIYSEHPDLRAVNIDGTTYRESEMIDNELRLEQVTPEGVVLNYRDRRFEFSIVDNWAEDQGA